MPVAKVAQPSTIRLATDGGAPVSVHAMQHDVLLVHGAFSNSGVWQTLAPYLPRAGANVATLDLPGHTAADASTAGSVTMDDYVARVVRALDAAPEPVVLVGHSLGCIIIKDVSHK